MPTNIGLEISATSVRMAKVSVKGHHKSLIAFAESSLPTGAVAEGAIIDKDAVVAAINQCLTVPRLKRGRFEKPLSVYIAVSGLRAISREIEAPAVPDSELDEAVRLQAMDLIPFPADKTLLSARRLSSTPYNPKNADGIQQVRVLLAAAHKDLVDPFIEVTTAAGLIPKGIDLASSALVRSLGDQILTKSSPEAIVSVGSDLTIVVVHDAGRPVFVRTIAEGGNSITRAIATSLDIPFHDAENIKKFVGRPDRHTPPVAVAVARDESTKIITEIKNSIDYFSSTYSGLQIQRVLVTGGGSRLAGFIDRLSQALPIQVERASCLRSVQGERIGQDTAPGSQLDDVAAIAIGLAIPEPAGVKRLDLLPKDFVSGKRIKHYANLTAVGVAFIILILILVYALKLLDIRNAENQVGHYQTEIATLNKEIPKYNKTAIAETKLATDKSLALPIVATEVNWPRVLQLLGTTTPNGVVMTQFTGQASYGPGATTVTTTTTAPTTNSSGTSTTTTTNTSSTAVQEPPPLQTTLPSSTQVLGTIQASWATSIGAVGYTLFTMWALRSSYLGLLPYQSYGTITSPPITSTSGATVWSAPLNIMGDIKTNRYNEFNVNTSVK